MAIKLNETNGGKVLEVQVTGKLTHEDYQHFVPEFERILKDHGKIRVLFEMVNFHGWEGVAMWDDIKFDVKHCYVGRYQVRCEAFFGHRSSGNGRRPKMGERDECILPALYYRPNSLLRPRGNR
jgi:hypothetical protein